MALTWEPAHTKGLSRPLSGDARRPDQQVVNDARIQELDSRMTSILNRMSAMGETIGGVEERVHASIIGQLQAQIQNVVSPRARPKKVLSPDQLRRNAVREWRRECRWLTKASHALKVGMAWRYQHELKVAVGGWYRVARARVASQQFATMGITAAERTHLQVAWGSWRVWRA